jgi:hypothetical protein
MLSDAGPHRSMAGQVCRLQPAASIIRVFEYRRADAPALTVLMLCGPTRLQRGENRVGWLWLLTRCAANKHY